MFESVDARMDTGMEFHTISSPGAFGSDELKIKFSLEISKFSLALQPEALVNTSAIFEP